MSQRLKDKVCLITGGGSGIGRATCELFAREGAKVAVADIALPAARAVAARIGAAATAIEVDVARSASVRAMIDTTVRDLGRLDVLINNAGYGITGSVTETSEDDWDKLMAVNVTGVFYGCKYAIPVMKKQGGGVIVSTASIVANVGIRNRAAYCASKGAVAALTRAMALDHVGDNIRVNCVGPGTTASAYFDDLLKKSDRPQELRRELETRQPMDRMARPEEIANAFLFLASDESSFCTGSMLVVDGGFTTQ
jgi:meso-butanediol dehydrogenase / (S,S)-butanediol dehydrogenase / diacetyl reductase